MARCSNRTFLRHVRVLFDVGTFAGLSDGQLLERFVGRSGEAAELAFAALVERHGPMVLRVCRGILAHPHDAEDAFQAVFLVLVRRARSVRNRESVASWLHGVALRVSGAARAARNRRTAHEQRVAERTSAAVEFTGAQHDLGPVLNEEIGRMPERYRAAVVLCYLEGRTYDEAARMLGCPVGTVKSRLSAARETLRVRLTRRGLAPVAGTLAGMLAGEAASAAVPRELAAATVRAALKVGTDTLALAGTVPAAVAALTEGTMTMFAWTKLRLTVALLLAIGIGGAGAGVVAQQSAKSGETEDRKDAVGAHGSEQPSARTPEASRLASAASPEGDKSRPTKVTIEQKLNEKITVNFEYTPLKEVIKFLCDRFDMNIVLDPEGLNEEGLTTASPVSLVASNIRLKTALKLLLKPKGLTYHIEDNLLLITSPRISQDPMRTETYYVGDLLPTPFKPGVGDSPPATRKVNMMPIMDMLISSVAPGTWSIYDPNSRERSGIATNGKEPIGSMTAFYRNCSLIVRHTAEVHEEIAIRLRQLRIVRYGDEADQARRPDPATAHERPSAEPTGVGAPDSAKPRRADDPLFDSRNYEEVETSIEEKPGVIAQDTPDPPKVYVGTLKSANLTRQERFGVNERVARALETFTRFKVVGTPDDADFILDWSLIPRSKP